MGCAETFKACTKDHKGAQAQTCMCIIVCTHILIHIIYIIFVYVYVVFIKRCMADEQDSSDSWHRRQSEPAMKNQSMSVAL